MSFYRALMTAAALLLLSACSQPSDVQTPSLEPQFGTADDDLGIDVVTPSTDRVYGLSQQFGANYPDEYDDYVNRSLLSRYDRNGNVVWSRLVVSDRCDPRSWYSGCTHTKPRAVYTDFAGYVYVLVSFYYPNEPDGLGPDLTYRLYKYDASGNRVWERDLSYSDNFYSYPDEYPVSVAFDRNNNIFVAIGQLYEDTPSSVTKYTNEGTLLWRRTSAVGTPKDIAVSSSGSVYVAGDKGIARYTNSGNVTWTKPGTFEKVMISGSNLYTRYRTNVFKFDGNGKQLWKKPQRGLASLVVAGMTGDGKGNVYLAGKYSATSTDRNAFIRKLNASGSALWTKTYGTSKYDDALSIDTLSGDEVYTTGSTQGALGHTNRGGGDGYLRKTNTSGTRVWTR